MLDDLHKKESCAVSTLGPKPQKPEVLDNIVSAFTALADAREVCLKSLNSACPYVELNFNPASFTLGTPVLSEAGNEFFRTNFVAAAKALFPAISKIFASIAIELEIMEKAMISRPEMADYCLKALLGSENEAGALWEIAGREFGVQPEIAAFAAREAFKVCLAKLEPLLAANFAGLSWYRGYCPICGSYPDYAYLSAKSQEPTEFLISKSGEMNLHCSDCGHRWRYLRVKCPYCGVSDHEKYNSLCIDDKDEERVYTCSECGRYLTCLDLTAGHSDIRFDTAALKLLHLEYVVRSRGFISGASQTWSELI